MIKSCGIITQSRALTQNYKNNTVKWSLREFNKLITKKEAVL